MGWDGMGLGVRTKRTAVMAAVTRTWVRWRVSCVSRWNISNICMRLDSVSSCVERWSYARLVDPYSSDCYLLSSKHQLGPDAEPHRKSGISNRIKFHNLVQHYHEGGSTEQDRDGEKVLEL
jgi:hypothetical protein